MTEFRLVKVVKRILGQGGDLDPVFLRDQFAYLLLQVALAGAAAAEANDMQGPVGEARSEDQL